MNIKNIGINGTNSLAMSAYTQSLNKIRQNNLSNNSQYNHVKQKSENTHKYDTFDFNNIKSNIISRKPVNAKPNVKIENTATEEANEPTAEKISEHLKEASVSDKTSALTQKTDNLKQKIQIENTAAEEASEPASEKATERLKESFTTNTSENIAQKQTSARLTPAQSKDIEAYMKIQNYSNALNLSNAQIAF